MRICIRPQNAHLIHSFFMIIFYWKQVQFHDHPVLEDSPAVGGSETEIDLIEYPRLDCLRDIFRPASF